MHFNLVPVHASLKDRSTRNMLGVLRAALLVCAAIYATVAVSGEPGLLRGAGGSLGRELAVHGI